MAFPGSLIFRLNSKTAYVHDYHSIEKSVIDNFRRSAFCLCPCEPNWIYAWCNHQGTESLVVYDRLFGTPYVESIKPRWLEALDTEMTDRAGAVVGLRSTYTGFEFTWPGGEAGYAVSSNTFDTELAWRRWATARLDLQRALLPGPAGERRLMIPGVGFDVGNYRSGNGIAYAGIASGAREFGDDELGDAAMRSLDDVGGRSLEGGVLKYTKMSNLANVFAMSAYTRRKDFWRDAFVAGPPESVFRGPTLAGANYPDVLVAKALSDGDGLDLVLYPGGRPVTQRLSVGRLLPNRRYRVAGAIGTESIVGDNSGGASFDVYLDGRRQVTLRPEYGV